MKKIEKEYQILIKMTPENKETAIGSSSGNPWMDMAVCLEGLSVICSKCIESGISSKKVYGEVFKYFGKMGDDYQIKQTEH